MVNDVKQGKIVNKNEKKDNKTRDINVSQKLMEKTSYKYGVLPKLSGQRIFSKGVVLGVLIYVWYFSKGDKESTLAEQGKVYSGISQHVDCDEEYLTDVKQYTGCIPKKCGRYVSDQIVTDYEAEKLLLLAKRGMSIAGSSGGATIMDLHSGELVNKERYINIYKSMNSNLITTHDLKIYQVVRQKVQTAIAESFEIDVNRIFFTLPTFFSRMTNKEPEKLNDVYWNVHVDKHAYESFHYTSLLYLNDYGHDFKGGRFIYMDSLQTPHANVSVEPRKGRVSMFTSGAENPHFVERVTEGERYAITIPFTCDKSEKLNDRVLSQKLK